MLSPPRRMTNLADLYLARLRALGATSKDVEWIARGFRAGASAEIILRVGPEYSPAIVRLVGAWVR